MIQWLVEKPDIDVIALHEVRAETKDLVELFEANPPLGKDGKKSQ
jgi:hypothetical protein